MRSAGADHVQVSRACSVSPTHTPGGRCASAISAAPSIGSSRAGEAALDRDGFADIMLRASHLAFQLGNEITELVLDRVVVACAPAASVVADAYILRAGAGFPR